MRYFKTVENGYILGIGIGIGNNCTEITESEYNQILSAVQSCPRREGHAYRLKTDLTWEEYELPPMPEEVDPEEALSILLGGDTE